MISQTFLKECQNPSRWHSSKMLSKTYPSSALLKPLMNTLQLHLDMVNGSFTCLSYTSYYDLLINACVRYDSTNISTTSKRRNVNTAAGAQADPHIDEPHKPQFSQGIETPSDDFYQVHQTKQGKPPPKPLSGFQKDQYRKPSLS